MHWYDYMPFPHSCVLDGVFIETDVELLLNHG